MSVLGRLATALGRNDEWPNVKLAEELAASGDKQAIRELVEALTTGSIAVQNDALKVLYEIGDRKPTLIAPYADAFLALLQSRNNRNVWGALQAIEAITPLEPKAVLAELDPVLAAADKGSVIAKDKAIGILVGLAAAGHGKKTLPILLDRLADAAPNQFPTYAEAIATVAAGPDKAKLAAVIEKRRPKVSGAAKAARLDKLLRKLAK